MLPGWDPRPSGLVAACTVCALVALTVIVLWLVFLAITIVRPLPEVLGPLGAG